MNNILKRIGNAGLVPVVVIDDAELAVPAAKALIDGGLEIMEITMRTDQALTAIKKVKKVYPQILLGAGTVLSIENAREAVDAGAEFIVSPGLNPELIEWCEDQKIVVTPGAVTPTEIQQALKFNLTVLKFFPGNIFGGIKGCEALYNPYRLVKFIPTGGISLNNLEDYASKPYIHAIGGSWLCSSADINNKDFDQITRIVKESIDILLGFELSDRVSSIEGEKGSLPAADIISDTLGFNLKRDNPAGYAETAGNIAIKTNNVDRAAYYIERKGNELDWRIKLEHKQGRIMLYLEGDTGDLAVHLFQE